MFVDDRLMMLIGAGTVTAKTESSTSAGAEVGLPTMIVGARRATGGRTREDEDEAARVDEEVVVVVVVRVVVVAVVLYSKGSQS